MPARPTTGDLLADGGEQAEVCAPTPKALNRIVTQGLGLDLAYEGRLTEQAAHDNSSLLHNLAYCSSKFCRV